MTRNFKAYGITIDTATHGKVRIKCPFCSESRTHNKGEKCLSVDLDLGLYHCFHCGESGYVPTDAELLEREERRQRRN